MRVAFSLIAIAAAQLDASKALETPPGEGALMNKMAAPLTAASNQSPQEKKNIIEQALDNAMDTAEEKLVANMRHAAMEADALAYATAQVRKLRYAGGCARDYEFQCPAGWLKAPRGSCAPSDAYAGVCGRLALAGKSAQEKENIAVKCGVEWPCVAACPLDFAACPKEWTERSGACEAPSHYTGICSKRTDFSSMQDGDKAHWASMCDATWPCKAEQAARVPEQLATLGGPIDEQGVAVQDAESAAAAAAPAKVQEIEYPVSNGPLV